MSLVPEFEIGVFNAWLGTVPALLVSFIAMFVNKDAGKRLVDTSWYSKKEKRLIFPSMIFSYGLALYSIAVPLKLGTVWFYTGLIIYVMGIIPLIMAYHNYATTPLNEPIVKGIYRKSRNPIYFFTSIMFLGAIIASASWLMLVLAILYSIVGHYIILAEERYCLREYGESYNKYMNQTPRYFLFF